MVKVTPDKKMSYFKKHQFKRRWESKGNCNSILSALITKINTEYK